MAATQSIVWTALPTGRTATQLNLSILVGPRLFGGGVPVPLSTFPDWVSWPSTPVAFDVFINGSLYGPATIVSPAPSAARWTDVFAASSTMVQTHLLGGPRQNTLRSTPVANLRQFLLQTYSQLLVTSGTEYPSASSLVGSGGPLAPPGEPDADRRPRCHRRGR
jgi:hypothetical protein